MENLERPFVHPFSTSKKYYLYDVNTNAVLNVPKDVHDHFANAKCDTALSESSIELVKNLQADGYLKKNPLEEIEHPLTPHLPFILDNQVECITLQITQQCNLRCKYCVYSGGYISREHSSKSLSIDLAKKAIDFLIAHSSVLNEVTIGFYGGEPLLKFDLIRDIVEYSEMIAEGKTLNYTMTTNGTLVNDEILDFLQRKNFSLLISLDGPKEIHDSNRVFAASGKGSFDSIMKNVLYIKEKYPKLHKNLTFSTVIDPSLNFTCSTKFFLNNTAIEDTTVLASVVGAEYKKEKLQISDDYIITSEEEHFKSMLSKIGRISSKYLSKVSENQLNETRNTLTTGRQVGGTLPKKFHPSGPCVPGARKLFMNTSGQFYPCERICEVSDVMHIGSIDTGFNIEQISTLLNIGKLTENECKKCWGFRLCPQCCLLSDDIKTLSKDKRLRACSSILKNHDESLKDYCTLLEHGAYLHDDNIVIFKHFGD